MKAECKKEDLIRGIALTEKVAGTNNALPVLSCFFISAVNNEVVIRSTNLDIGIEATIPASVSEEGVCVVSAQTLSKTINSEYGHSVTLLSDEGNLKVKTEHAETVIKGQDPEEFPKLPYVEDADPITVPSDVFAKGIQSVVYSASTTTIRPELSSVYVYPKSKELVFVATDSFRLAEKSVATQKGATFDSILIPFRNAVEIARIAGLTEGEITLSFNESQMGVTAPGVYITTRIIDGAFPEYEKIIPTEGVTNAIVLKHDLQQALKKTAVFADAFNHITFHLYPKKKTFTISSRNQDVGETFDTIPAALSGDDLDIGFNLRYVLDVLPYIQNESLELMFAGPGKPLLIRGKGDAAFRYIVMPMNR